MGQNLFNFLSIGVWRSRDACPPSQTMSPYCCILHQAVIWGDRESWTENYRRGSNDRNKRRDVSKRLEKKNMKVGLEVKKEGEGPGNNTNWFTKTMTFLIFSDLFMIFLPILKYTRGKASHHLSSSPQSGCLSQLAQKTLHSMAQPWSAPPLVFDSCPRLLVIAHAVHGHTSEAYFCLLSTSLNSIYPCICHKPLFLWNSNCLFQSSVRPLFSE